MKPNTTSKQQNNHSPWQDAPRQAKGLLQSFLGRTDRLTLCAEIERLQASTDGSFVLTLSLALGKLEFLISEAQAETLSAAHACTFSVRRLGELIVADLKALDPYCPRPACCWVSSPGMNMGRPRSLAKLKEVLGALKPTHQAVVLSMLSHSRAEKTLRTGVAALDHHCYPGGWLDASLKAVDVIKGRRELGTDQRSLLSAAALIFDAGRLTRNTIGMDSERLVMVGRIRGDVASTQWLTCADESTGEGLPR